MTAFLAERANVKPETGNLKLEKQTTSAANQLGDLGGLKIQNENHQFEKLTLQFGEAGRMVKSYDRGRAITVKMPQKATLEFVKVPAGEYVMGNSKGAPNEKPRRVKIEKPFWISTTEISNEHIQSVRSDVRQQICRFARKRSERARSSALSNETACSSS